MPLARRPPGSSVRAFRSDEEGLWLLRSTHSTEPALRIPFEEIELSEGALALSFARSHVPSSSPGQLGRGPNRHSGRRCVRK